jgi:hypothetical protein
VPDSPAPLSQGLAFHYTPTAKTPNPTPPATTHLGHVCQILLHPSHCIRHHLRIAHGCARGLSSGSSSLLDVGCRTLAILHNACMFSSTTCCYIYARAVSAVAAAASLMLAAGPLPSCKVRAQPAAQIVVICSCSLSSGSSSPLYACSRALAILHNACMFSSTTCCYRYARAVSAVAAAAPSCWRLGPCHPAQCRKCHQQGEQAKAAGICNTRHA